MTKESFSSSRKTFTQREYTVNPDEVASERSPAQMNYGGWRNIKTGKNAGSQEEPRSCAGFPVGPSIHVIYSHCLPILISMIREQSVAMLQGHQDGKSLAIRGHLCTNTVAFTHECHNLILRFSCFSVSLNFDDGHFGSGHFRFSAILQVFLEHS